MNIGIFSGSFNPIHIGHLILGNYATEFGGLDEVWYLVTPQNPLKDGTRLLDQFERLEMITRAVENYPKMKASDFEFSLPLPAYTENTLKKLSKAYPLYKFSLIIGADNWSIFQSWKNYEYIIDNFEILIYPRLNYTVNIPQNYKDQVRVLDAPIIEISSSYIREAISANKDIQSFLPPEVYSYIQNKKLYKNTI